MIEAFRRITDLARVLVGETLTDGDVAIDATVGTGVDTVFMAEKVGASGRVYGYDIQTEAIAQTEKRLAEKNLGDRVILKHGSHAKMTLNPSEEAKAIMFNLGYLPGGNLNIVTQPESTILALEKALTLLGAGGIITIGLYRHSGSEQEVAAVEEWASRLSRGFYAHRIETINRRNPPYLIAIHQMKKRRTD